MCSKTAIPLFIVLSAFFISCINNKGVRLDELTVPAKNSFAHAERFTVHKKDSCTIVTIIDPWQGAEKVRQVYYLVERGKNAPQNAEASQIIYVPVRKIICMSSTHLAMVSALGEHRAISGISGTNYIFDDVLRSRADSGQIVEVGYDSEINDEVILKTDPDLIMMYGIGLESAGYVGKISELGVKIMFNADYLETDPLGKAEWIKVFGALFCKENLADSIFQAEVISYNSIKSSIEEGKFSRPSVLLGLPFRDTWFVSPGNSYISTIISDAGGKYLWGEYESSTSMPFSLEAVYMNSLNADYWLNAGNATSLADIAALEPRLTRLPCYTSGRIYNNTKRTSPGGGNDYWESGSLNPHIILKDIASILHPGLFREHELYYYKKLN
jgi:iron complex transport system substrate-binding protein